MKRFIVLLFTSFCAFANAQDTTITLQQEIDTLYSDVIDNIANYKAMHKLSLPNSVPLSTWQLALPVNTKKNSKGALLETTKVELPARKEDLAFYSISEIAYLIKKIS